MTHYPKRTRTPFGERIFQERERTQLTQAEIAESLGTSPAYISQVERGSEPPTPRLIHAFADAYDVDPDELYALAERVPVDIIERLTGDLRAIKTVRQALQIPQQGPQQGQIRGPGPASGTSKDDSTPQHNGKEAPNAPPTHRVK